MIVWNGPGIFFSLNVLRCILESQTKPQLLPTAPVKYLCTSVKSLCTAMLGVNKTVLNAERLYKKTFLINKYAF